MTNNPFVYVPPQITEPFFCDIYKETRDPDQYYQKVNNKMHCKEHEPIIRSYGEPEVHDLTDGKWMESFKKKVKPSVKE